MGGYLAIVAAPLAGARAVVAICPATAEGLRRGLRTEAFGFDADVPALDAVLAEHDPADTLRGLEVPVLLLHAEGDERVPVENSRALAGLLRSPRSRLITVPGGHHRSVQHDPGAPGGHAPVHRAGGGYGVTEGGAALPAAPPAGAGRLPTAC